MAAYEFRLDVSRRAIGLLESSAGRSILCILADSGLLEEVVHTADLLGTVVALMVAAEVRTHHLHHHRHFPNQCCHPQKWDVCRQSAWTCQKAVSEQTHA